MTDGVLRVFGLPSSLIENRSPSAHAFAGGWQVAHDMRPLVDSRGSKNSVLPSSNLSRVSGSSVGTISAGASARPSGAASGSAGSVQAARTNGTAAADSSWRRDIGGFAGGGSAER